MYNYVTLLIQVLSWIYIVSRTQSIPVRIIFIVLNDLSVSLNLTNSSPQFYYSEVIVIPQCEFFSLQQC